MSPRGSKRFSSTDTTLSLAGHKDLVYEIAARRVVPSEAFDQFAPGWRHAMAAGFEAFVADDGQ
jgi:hypothetical protein